MNTDTKGTVTKHLFLASGDLEDHLDNNLVQEALQRALDNPGTSVTLRNIRSSDDEIVFTDADVREAADVGIEISGVVIEPDTGI